MKTFECTINEPIGLHARPAGILVKEAGKFSSAIFLSKGEKTANAKRLFNLMEMGIKCGDIVTLWIDGEDEEEASVAIEKVMSEHL